MPTNQQARGSPDGANGGSAAAVDSRSSPGPGEPAQKRGVGQRPHGGTSAAGDGASTEDPTAPRLSLLPSSPERDPAARPRPSSAPSASSSRPQSPLSPPAVSPPVSCGPTSSVHAGAPHHPAMTLLRKAGPSTQLSVVTPAKPEYSSSRTFSVQSFTELMDGLDLSNSDAGSSRLQPSAAAVFSPADHERDSTSEAAGTAQDVDITGPGGDSVGAVSGVVEEVLVGLSDSRPSAARRDGSQSSARQSATSSSKSSAVTPTASPVRPESIAVDAPLVPDEGESPRRHRVVESSPRLHSEEDPNSSLWRQHEKHFFVLSSAGKPIYTRYGDESKISSHMGVVQAIVSFFVDEGDMIRCINAGDHKFVFLTRGHLYLVTVARTGETEMQLRDQLLYLYNAIISILTLSQLTRIFERHGNFDLRRLLGGTETFIDSICDGLDDDPAYLLGAMRCLRMPKELRTAIGESLLVAKCKSLLYGMLIAKTKLITLVRPKKHSLHPSDLHLLFNMVAVSSAFKTGGEYWTPICLPRFNSKGFLHAYVCYILPDVCLLLLTPDKDAFFDLSACKDMFLEFHGNFALKNMATAGSMTRLGDALDDSDYTIAEIGIPGLRHFLYKSKKHVQYTCPHSEDEEERLRLYRLYRQVHGDMHSRALPRSVYHLVTQTEAVLGLAATGLELYATFAPHMSKASINAASLSLVKWVRREGDRLFLSNSPVFG